MERVLEEGAQPMPMAQRWKVCSQSHLKQDLVWCNAVGACQAATGEASHLQPGRDMRAARFSSQPSCVSLTFFRAGTVLDRKAPLLNKNSSRQNNFFFLIYTECIFCIHYSISWHTLKCVQMLIVEDFHSFSLCQPYQASHGFCTHLNTSFTCVMWDSSSWKRKTKQRCGMIRPLHKADVVGNVNILLLVSSSEQYWYYSSRLLELS